MKLKFYNKNIRIEEIEKFRKNSYLRPLIFKTTNQINNLYLSLNNENEIYNKNNVFLINEIYGISYFIDDDAEKTKFINLEYGYQFCLKYKLLSIKYSLGSLNISTKKPYIIFNSNLSINFLNFGFQLPHYSDWFLSKEKGYDIPYSLVIPLTFL